MSKRTLTMLGLGVLLVFAVLIAMGTGGTSESAPIAASPSTTEERPLTPEPTTTTTVAPTTTTTTTTTAPPPAPTTTEAPAPEPAPAGIGNGDPYDDASWYRLYECESAGLGWAVNTGNGYYGGLQFSLSSWQAVGGSGYPHEASAAEQIARGKALWEQGGWAHWPACTRSFGWR